MSPSSESQRSASPSSSAEGPEAPKQTRKRRRFVKVVLVLVILLLLVPISNLVFYTPGVTALTSRDFKDAQFKTVCEVVEQKCVSCHMKDPALPFYAHLPLASSLVVGDVRQGQMHIDLVEALGGTEDIPANEVTLAKLEYVLKQDSMPPGRFLLMHWNKGLSGKEKKAILGWIENTRKTHFAVDGVADAHATEAVQPLSEPEGLDPKKVALGDVLYHDVRLSGDDTLSCASCHALDKGGTDHSKTSTGIDGQIGPINAPTVYNAVFAIKQFWDGRAEDLQEQAGGPVNNPIEMGSNWDQVISKLKADDDLTKKFKEVYADGWSGENITNAIAEFEKSLVTTNSRFDQYLRGNEDALNAEEKKGYALFKAWGCSSCHVGPAMGGRSFERMGLEADYFADRGDITDVDLGRYNVTRREEDRHRFKVPTLRNVAVTYPYFHDGSKKELAEAVQAMAHYQRGRDLTAKETAALVAFLKTLTGDYEGRRLDEITSEKVADSGLR